MIVCVFFIGKSKAEPLHTIYYILHTTYYMHATAELHPQLAAVCVPLMHSRCPVVLQPLSA